MLNYFRESYIGSCAIEIKVARGNSVPKSALKDHQRAALLAARAGGIVHKLTDEARRQQPFDAFKLQGVPAYVVCVFTTEGHAEALAIDVRDWQGATNKSDCAFRFTP